MIILSRFPENLEYFLNIIEFIHIYEKPQKLKLIVLFPDHFLKLYVKFQVISIDLSLKIYSKIGTTMIYTFIPDLKYLLEIV